MYACGFDGFDACYWKNGKQVLLTGYNVSNAGQAHANGIYISGNDIYLAGDIFESSTATKNIVYWKNGTEVTLTGTQGVLPSTTYQANSIFSSGGDVYVAGWATDTLGYVYAAYWKNGTATYLNASFTNALPLTQQYRATSVYISGSDVYVAGYTGYDQTKGIAAAVYWKNGALTKLTDGSTRATTNSIVVSGSDVYVGGSDGIQPRLWKNGKPVNLPVSSPYGSYVLGVVVK